MVSICGLGERAVVERIARQLGEKVSSSIVLGAGEDDCAVLDLGGKDYLVVTTDMLHRKTDFPLEMSPWQIGWMAVAVNLSDLAAKGALPIGILMAMGLPEDTDLAFLEEMVAGMKACAKSYNVQIIGGDTDSHDELTLVGTALGLVPKELLVRRKGAQIGDLVCVTGHLGAAGAALKALKEGLPASNRVLSALFEPKARIREGMALAESRAVTSMMDISDGLALSLYDLARVNNVGFKVYYDRLPILEEVREIAGDDGLLELAAYSGGDFGLLLTVKAGELEKVREACRLTVIGEVIEEGILMDRQGSIEVLEARGYEHLRSKE